MLTGSFRFKRYTLHKPLSCPCVVFFLDYIPGFQPGRQQKSFSCLVVQKCFSLINWTICWFV